MRSALFLVVAVMLVVAVPAVANAYDVIGDPWNTSQIPDDLTLGRPLGRSICASGGLSRGTNYYAF